MAKRAAAELQPQRDAPVSALELAVRVAALEETLERHTAISYVLSSRISDLEAGAGAEAPAIDRVITIKGAAFLTKFSPSQIRKWIRAGRITARKIGGRVVIDAASLPAARVRKDALNARAPSAQAVAHDDH